MTTSPLSLPPAEAIAFFKRKGLQLGFDWRDVDRSTHAAAFTVAKMMDVDLLTTTRAAVDRAIAEGRTFEQFRDELEPALRAAGWWGRQEATDPVTGETRPVQLGSERRLRTIFQVNVRTAYAAGQWERIARIAPARPWLRYVAVMDRRTRADHRAWHGTVLRWDDPWWGGHFPPNGWNCRCTVQQLSDADLARRGLSPSPKAPPGGERVWLNRRTGAEIRVPAGVDPGFEGHVGIEGRAARLTRQLMERAAAAPADIAADAVPVVAAQLDALTRLDWKPWVDRYREQVAAKTIFGRGEVRIVGLLDPEVTAALKTLPGGPVDPVSLGLTITDEQLLHAIRSKKSSPADPTVLDRLPTLLRSASVLWDTEDAALIFAIEAPGGQIVKVVVDVNYRDRVRVSDGRVRLVTNAVTTVTTVSPVDLPLARYPVIVIR